MPTLPIGFFMPLPLPVMIPFMMWQSAAIAAGFGTYFQYAKRRVSAMSNDEFNKSSPHDLVNTLYEEIVAEMPSSFKKIDTMTPIILDSMLKMLTDAVKWFATILGGSLDSPFKFDDQTFHNIPDTSPLPDNTNLPLINISAEDVGKLTNIELFHIVENQFHLYDVPSQQRLKQFYDIRIKGSKDKRDTTLETFASKDEAIRAFVKTLPTIQLFRKNFTKPQMATLQSIKTYKQFLLYSQKQRFAIKKLLQKTTSDFHQALRQKILEAWNQLFIQSNKFVGNTP